MQHLTPVVIRDITRGDTVGELPLDEITAITTDSRTVVPGCLFAAIPGARVDGHDFIASAAEKGASCILCNRFVEADIPQICVKDTQKALCEIAAFYRSQFEFPFVGVTGSVGKTTAKEMIASVLSSCFNTLRTEKNFNNELGVPLTLFRLQKDHEAAVVEMGISDFGEMTRLSDMVRPDIAVFTLIGDAHLEFLGDHAGVLKAKAEILSGMPPDGLVIANGDDPMLKDHKFGCRTIRFGFGENCDVRAENWGADGETAMSCVIVSGERRIVATIPAFGLHMIYAALMGAAVGMELGLSDQEIQSGIANYKTVGSRGRILHRGGIVILDDCYNANPTSCRSSLESLSMLPGRKVAVLGDMLELGESGPALHQALGEYASALGVRVIACGELSRCTTYGAGAGALWFENTDALISALPALIREGDSILVKASRGMHFETVVNALCRE